MTIQLLFGVSLLALCYCGLEFRREFRRVDSDAKCDTLGRPDSPRNDRIFPPSPPLFDPAIPIWGGPSGRILFIRRC
jgi:hypothetical protein